MTTPRDAARDSARTLWTTAAILLTIVSLAAVGGVVIGASSALNHHGHARVHDIELAVGAALVGLFAILPFLAAQTFARFVEWRVADPARTTVDTDAA